jgi:aminoglycoside phosphotransferase (APT) family kinase protein
MSKAIDSTSAVREGEELDGAKLEKYLLENIEGLEGPLVVEQFPRGHSNLTYLIRMGDKEMVLRRPPFGSTVKGAHDMGREYTVLSKLHGLYAPAPNPLLFCEDHEIIGADFYVMERKRGIVLRNDKPEGYEFDADTVRRICEAFIDNLAELHNLDWETAGLGVLRRDGSYMERQIKGWAKRWDGSKTDDIPAMDKAAAWLAEHLPEDSGAVLVHNDYKFDNIMLDPADLTKVVGVFDWEMATIGDPLADLATTLGYWSEPGDDQLSTTQCFLTTLEGAPTRKELAARYAEKTGRDVTNIHYYYVLALFKLAVILQQIYYRYHHGLTKDERFGALIFLVKIIADNAEKAIDKKSI